LQTELSSMSPWSFQPLRRRPLLRLDNGEILVIRLGWLIERSMGTLALDDIEEHLGKEDVARGTRRLAAFKRCVQAKLEEDVGRSMRRAFSKRGATVWHESDLARALAPFQQTSQPSKLCDYVIRVGSTWLLVDATDRRIPAHVADGSTGLGGLHTELRQALTGHKARQLESTIRLLRDHMDVLTGQPIDHAAEFIPIVTNAQGGLLWGWTVSSEAASQLAEHGLLQDPDVLPAALMSPKDLSLLERQAQHDGVRAIEIVRDWRAGELGQWAFDQYLHLTGHRLAATKAERRDANLLIRKVIQRAKATLRASR
jgi:hypothetical protein